MRRGGALVHILVNDQVRLSEFRPSDTSALVEHLREKGIYVRTLRIPFPYTQKHAEEWLGIVARATEQHGRPVHWAIRNAADLLIGAVGFDGVQLGKSHRAEIGYWLAKPYWGQGIMTAVVRRVCQFAFDEFALVKITAHVFATNQASAHVLEKCGFVQEGFLRKHFVKDDQYLDARLYALVR